MKSASIVSNCLAREVIRET